ncbi:MAG: hypothetical protein VB108_03875 [Anaerolineaceae bacterium]|nr:hypothetical protein [Anaerolineaceae bacterium]
MNNRTPFEDKIYQSFALKAINPSFVARLESKLQAYRPETQKSKPKPFTFSLKWSYAFAPLLLLLVFVFAVGPQRVYAQIQKWMGFVPGAGLVTETTSLRILAEPVSQTRDGVTLGVLSGVLSSERTSLEVKVSDAPFSAHFSQNFGKEICHTNPYLLLPDGTKLEYNGAFPAIPANIDSAVYVLPCIDMYIRGALPEDWRIPMHFIAAPEDLHVYPVLVHPKLNVEKSQPAVSKITPTAEKAVPSTLQNDIPIKNIFDILLVIEKPDAWEIGYGFKALHLDLVLDNNEILVKDANGKSIPINHTFPDAQAFHDELQEVTKLLNEEDGYPNPYYSMYKGFSLPKGDYAFPLTFEVKVKNFSWVDVPRDQPLFEFDAGPNPKLGDTWPIHKTLDLNGHKVQVLSAEVHEWGGYCVNFDGGSDIFNVDISLIDYQTNFGAGTSAPFEPPFTFRNCFMISPLPTGKIRVGLRQEPIYLVESFIARGTWSPSESLKP